MSGRTALEIAGVHRPLTAIEIADDLDAGLNSYGTCSLAARTIRQQHAEIERLTEERVAAIAAAVDAEREACAAVCESEADKSVGWAKVRMIEMANRMRRDISARAKP
jgi:hypothetical protein